MPEPTAGRIITFYSYKGGTGRSMALANVAWILASSGLKVLAIDWDLEAPGLHRYFHPFLLDNRLSSSPGIIDWIVEFATAALTRGDKLGKASSDPRPPAGEWFHPYADLTKYAVSLDFDFPQRGTLDFIPAGKQDPGYSIRVNSFNWKDLYEKLGGGVFLEATKNALRTEYDYILIDSRTGVSDTSGICTIQMPDELVVCFTLNSQSIQGAGGAAQSARAQRVTPTGENSIKIWPVPMRIETSEKERRDRAMTRVITKFNVLIDHLSPEQQDEYWGRVQVPYLPFYAFEETLASLADKIRQSNTLLSSMEFITGYISGGAVTSLKVLDEHKRRAAVVLFSRSSVEDSRDDLVRAAREYEIIREKMAPGEDRTYLMTALVDRVRVLLQDSDPGDFAGVLFDMKKAGPRIVGLALAQLAPKPSNIELAIQAIAEPLSAFEQYHALVLGNVLLRGSNEEEKRRLGAAIVSQQSKYITPVNSDRWALANAIMNGIEADTVSQEASKAGTEENPESLAPIGQPLVTSAGKDDRVDTKKQGSPSGPSTSRKPLLRFIGWGVIVLLMALIAIFTWHRRVQSTQSASNTTPTPTQVSGSTSAVKPPEKQAPVLQDGWGIVLSSDESVEPISPGSPSGIWEVLLAWRVGYRNLGLFHRGNAYWTVIQEPDEPSTEAALKKVTTAYPQYPHWKRATKVNLLTWCSNPAKSNTVTLAEASAALYECAGSGVAQ